MVIEVYHLPTNVGPNKSIWIYYGILHLINWMPYYLGIFDINYIIFRDIEIFQKKIIFK